MSVNISRWVVVTVIVSVLSVIVSCTSSLPTAKSISPADSQNSPPKVVDIVGIREWKPLQEGTLICASEDAANLKYSWSAEQGTIKGEGKQVTWIAPNAPGNYDITVQVSNPRGKETTFRKSFKVTTNPYNNDTPDKTIYLQLTLPSSAVITEKAHPRIWTTSEIECVVTGANESDLTYRWSAPTGKLAGNGLADGKAKRVGWIAPGVGGLYKVSVVVTDMNGNEANGEVNFDVYCCKE